MVENSVKGGRQGQMRCEQKKDEVVVRQHASAKWNAKWTGLSARNWAHLCLDSMRRIRSAVSDLKKPYLGISSFLSIQMYRYHGTLL